MHHKHWDVWNTRMQANSKQKTSVEAGTKFCFSSLNLGDLIEVTEFNLVISWKNSDVQLTLQALESENVWIADTGATSHVTKHKIGGINHCGMTVKNKGIYWRVDQPGAGNGHSGLVHWEGWLRNQCRTQGHASQQELQLWPIQHDQDAKEKYLLGGNEKFMKLKKGAHEFTFESVIRTKGGAKCFHVSASVETWIFSNIIQFLFTPTLEFVAVFPISVVGLLASSQRYSMIKEEEACWLWPEKKLLLEKVKEGVVVVPKRKLWDLKMDLKMKDHEACY